MVVDDSGVVADDSGVAPDDSDVAAGDSDVAAGARLFLRDARARADAAFGDGNRYGRDRYCVPKSCVQYRLYPTVPS